MEEIDQLQNDYCNNEAEIVRLNELNFKLRDRIVEMKFGVKPGVIVRETKTGQKFKVVSARGRGWVKFGKPWVKATPFKKDGTLGKRVQEIYNDWEVVSE